MALLRELRAGVGRLVTTIPVIALTAHAGRRERDRILAAGAEHLVKPVEVSQLLAVMREVLGRPGA